MPGQCVCREPQSAPWLLSPNALYVLLTRFDPRALICCFKVLGSVICHPRPSLLSSTPYQLTPPPRHSVAGRGDRQLCPQRQRRARILAMISIVPRKFTVHHTTYIFSDLVSALSGAAELSKAALPQMQIPTTRTRRKSTFQLSTRRRRQCATLVPPWEPAEAADR